MITEKEVKMLMDKAYLKTKDKLDFKATFFLDRIKHKLQRYKKLNEVEEKKLREFAK